MIPCFAKRDGSFELNALKPVVKETDVIDKAEKMLIDVNMIDKRNEHAASLSRGDKRRLEMAMCLAQDPKLLLLDEPTAGMARADTNNTIDLLKEIQEQRGITMAIIEHDMHVVFSLAEKITVLGAGYTNCRGYPGKHQRAPESAGSLSWGGTLMAEAQRASETINPNHEPSYFSVWEIHSYYGESFIVQNVSFSIHEGEILALLGRNGAGKTSTLRSIARLSEPAVTRGEIWLDHQPIHSMASHEASQAGIQLVPEDRRIIQGLTVEENLKLAQIEKPMSAGR